MREFFISEDGQDMVEYSLLLGFIVVSVIGLLSGISTGIKGIFSTINSSLNNAATSAS